MKQILTMAMIIMALQPTNAQVVLNEIYPEPGAGRHEFFELYNTSTSSVEYSVDGYTIMSFFEEGKTKGFYVLDLPDLTIEPRGFFVGASAKPISYQSSVSNNQVDFSWNDPSLNTNYGYLQKWEQSTDNDASDGNQFYNLSPLSAFENDIIQDLSGKSAAYNVFIFKNGILINTFMGNTKGFPSKIESMPLLKVNQLNSTGNFTFDVDFDIIKNKPFEDVRSDIGTDNGYIRTQDGFCNSWTKGSSQVQHTPNSTNGKMAKADTEVTLTASILRGLDHESTSKLIYEVVSAASSSFPLEIQLYLDNGSVTGELDAGDTYYESNTILSILTTPYTSVFAPKDADILIGIKTGAGCLDQVKYVPNSAGIILPLTIKSFTGQRQQQRNYLQWTVEENESLDHVVLEKKVDDQYVNIAVIMGTAKAGTEEYKYFDVAGNHAADEYRLKVLHTSGKITYSKTILITNGKEALFSAALSLNPVQDVMRINVNASDNDLPVQIKVIDQYGRMILKKDFTTSKGHQTFVLHESATFSKGYYFIEVNSGTYKQTLKSVKL